MSDALLISANLLAVTLVVIQIAKWFRALRAQPIGVAIREGIEIQARDDREEARRVSDGLRKELVESMARLSKDGAEQAERLRDRIDGQLEKLRQGNEAKLEAMRSTVDEKLQGTLERRLGESFSQVNKTLQDLHKGIGEVNSLADGVGDLKRVMANVKARGTWGEVQLETLLEDFLSTGQFDREVAIRPESGERVDFVVRLPGIDVGDERGVMLPIDAKFPIEDYQRLLEAQEIANPADVEREAAAFEKAIRLSAKSIAEKYISPPLTTDFAVLFLPTEGLFSEVVRREGLVAECRRKHQVIFAGPTTLAALLGSLRMGFRTLAVQERASEVWQVLQSVKSEFDKFGGVLAKVKKKLEEASKAVDQVETRERAMKRALRSIEAAPIEEAGQILRFDSGGDCVSALVDPEPCGD